jgi:hypothetical protein
VFRPAQAGPDPIFKARPGTGLGLLAWRAAERPSLCPRAASCRRSGRRICTSRGWRTAGRSADLAWPCWGLDGAEGTSLLSCCWRPPAACPPRRPLTSHTGAQAARRPSFPAAAVLYMLQCSPAFYPARPGDALLFLLSQLPPSPPMRARPACQCPVCAARAIVVCYTTYAWTVRHDELWVCQPQAVLAAVLPQVAPQLLEPALPGLPACSDPDAPPPCVCVLRACAAALRRPLLPQTSLP